MHSSESADSVESVAQAIKGSFGRCAILADGHPDVHVRHSRRLVRVEERVGHHGDSFLDRQPPAEGEIEWDVSIGHVQAILVYGRSSILHLVVVRLEVLLGHETSALSYISHDEVASLAEYGIPGHGHLSDSLSDRVSVLHEHRGS